MPRRIQRSRAKGWRMPEGAIYVGRGSIWGNPFIVGEPSGVFPASMGLRGQAETLIPALSIERALEFYRNVWTGYLTPEMYPAGHAYAERIRHYSVRALCGRDLCCWCPLVDKSGDPVPCHADVLLELANSGAGSGERE